MYPDAKRIRNNRIMVRLDDYEHSLVTALANYQGNALATVIRQLIMHEAAAVLLNDAVSLPRQAAQTKMTISSF
jgi:uncharacterized protein (DUF1778 family)